MSNLIKTEKILGKPYIMVGDANSDLILNGKGNVKIRFGNIFLDLIKDGKVVSDSNKIDIINEITNINDIGENDGFYLDSNNLILYIKNGDKLYSINLKNESNENISSDEYLAINYIQDLFIEQIETAQKNIKYIIDSSINTSTIPNNIAYFASDLKYHVLNYNGTLKELYLNLSNGGIVNNKVTINTLTNSHGSGDLNVIGKNGLEISNSGNKLTILNKSNYFNFITNKNGIFFQNKLSDSLGTYINGNYLSIGYEPSYNYNLEIFGNGYIKDKLILGDGISSTTFISGKYGTGYNLYNSSGDWILELDKLYVRDAIYLNDELLQLSTSESFDKELITTGLNKNFYLSQCGIIQELLYDYEENETIPTDEEGTEIPNGMILSNIYNLKVDDILEFEEFVYMDYYYNESDIKINPNEEDIEFPENEEDIKYQHYLYTKIKGQFLIEEITIESPDPESRIILKGKFQNNKIENKVPIDLITPIDFDNPSTYKIVEKITYPFIGTKIYKYNKDEYFYINIVDNNPYLKVHYNNYDIKIGHLGNVEDPLDYNIILTDDIVGIYSTNLYAYNIHTYELNIRSPFITIGTRAEVPILSAVMSPTSYGIRLIKSGSATSLTQQYYLYNYGMGEYNEWRCGTMILSSVDFVSYPITIRNESNTFTNDHIVVWDSTIRGIKDSGKAITELSGSPFPEDGTSTSYLAGDITWKDTISIIENNKSTIVNYAKSTIDSYINNIRDLNYPKTKGVINLNGIKIQYGYVGENTTSGQEITFYEPFTLYCFSVVVSGNRSSSGANGFNYVNNVTKTGFTVYFDNCPGYFIAIGI